MISRKISTGSLTRNIHRSSYGSIQRESFKVRDTIPKLTQRAKHMKELENGMYLNLMRGKLIIKVISKKLCKRKRKPPLTLWFLNADTLTLDIIAIQEPNLIAIFKMGSNDRLVNTAGNQHCHLAEAFFH